MSKGKEIIKGHTFYGTPEFLAKLNEGRTRKIGPEVVVLNGEKVAAAIDTSLNYGKRQVLQECLQIVREEGCDFEAATQRIERLLLASEWPSKELHQKAQPEEVESQPENPYMVKPPI